MYIKLFEDNPNTRDILKVVEVLKAGGIIIYPTDTIYAIGCDINNVKAVQRVCQLKNIKPEKAIPDFSGESCYLQTHPSHRAKRKRAFCL